jgi:hypothetical protein
MRHCNSGSFREQVGFLRRQFLQGGDLPFTDVLTEEIIALALSAINGWLGHSFSPLVTLWVFMGQVLSADHSCRAAVARLIAPRLARGQRPCSADTGAYCQARKRLPEQFVADVACSVGRALDDRAQRRWLWKGRRVYLFDGTTMTMPDTAKNRAAYPQVYNQKPGLGFPIARLGALISLACGAVVNLGFCCGKWPCACVPLDKVVELTFDADRNQLFTAWNAIANLADLAGKVRVTIRAESETGFDKGKLQNGVMEPLREADLIE